MTDRAVERRASSKPDAAGQGDRTSSRESDAAAAVPSDEQGRWLLWLTGAAAVALGAVALALWGTRGGTVLLDLLIAFCA